MDDLTVRLTGIKLKNFKNVKYGELDRESSVFIPVAKYECLIGKDKEEMMDLLVAKRMAYMTSRSILCLLNIMKRIILQLDA